MEPSAFKNPREMPILCAELRRRSLLRSSLFMDDPMTAAFQRQADLPVWIAEVNEAEWNESNIDQIMIRLSLICVTLGAPEDPDALYHHIDIDFCAGIVAMMKTGHFSINHTKTLFQVVRCLCKVPHSDCLQWLTDRCAHEVIIELW
jgi:hypothetical protein